MTQSELAEKLNYSDKAVSKWERGESLPDILVLSSLTDMYGVPLDYLIHDHSNEKIKPENPHKKRNHIIITLLSIALVWLLATIAVVILTWAAPNFRLNWVIFAGALFVSEIVALVFNSIWGNTKFNYLIITAMLWTALVTFYFVFRNSFITPRIFFIGIPAQIIIVFWSVLYFKHKDKSKTAEDSK